MALQLRSLRRSLQALSEVAAVSDNDERMGQLSDVERVAIRAGVVQHFEITYELCWKLMARWLNSNVSPGVADGVTRRQLFRLAAERQLIQDVDRWMSHHEGRNATSHIYDFAKADAVYRATIDFVHDARALLRALEARND
ncbi:MAG: HI0074 family nucleotidyltransferase substrate-binding subunit [Bryobacterales bacterium]|nr:HI0074 family nucleotidyltransferase substrate-binding subunit [Bryobacterales bacterium]